MTPVMYEASHDFYNLTRRAVLTEQGAVLLILSWWPGHRRRADWHGHRFTVEILEALAQFEEGDDELLRGRTQALRKYHAGLSIREAARIIERSCGYTSKLMRAVARHGVAENVLRYPLKYP